MCSSDLLPDADPVTVQCTVTNTGGSTVYIMPPTGTISGTGGIVGQPGGPWPKTLAAGASVVINWGVAFFDAGTYQLGATVYDYYQTVRAVPTPVTVTVTAQVYPVPTIGPFTGDISKGVAIATGTTEQKSLSDWMAMLASPSDLSVTATGSTTARTLAARAADVVNVKDFLCDDGKPVQGDGDHEIGRAHV